MGTPALQGKIDEQRGRSRLGLRALGHREATVLSLFVKLGGARPDQRLPEARHPAPLFRPGQSRAAICVAREQRPAFRVPGPEPGQANPDHAEPPVQDLGDPTDQQPQRHATGSRASNP